MFKMESSDNLITMEPWFVRPTFAGAWLPESFTRDNETLKKALENSLSNQSNNLSSDAFNPPCPPDTSPTPTRSRSETETVVSTGRSTAAVGVNGGKITKRNPRKPKRSTTTYFTADPANFRRMVQQVTGAKIDGNSQLPVSAMFRPEPKHRPDSNRMQSSCLLTLDTSASWLDPIYQHRVGPASALVGQPAAAVNFPPTLSEVVADGGCFDFDSFCSFPTLDSWETK